MRYEFSIFDQVIRDVLAGWITDKWLRARIWNPRPEIVFDVKLGGHTETMTERPMPRAMDSRLGRACFAYDTPVLGYKGHTANCALMEG